MAVFKDTIMIKDQPFKRAVRVTVIYPDDMNVTNVQELAEKAWRSVNKEITIGRVTVRVRTI
jgi:divalent metal cation (Fe/Co/Zn/Cd) transporter